MISEFEIENFRGFSQSKFSGFGRINLIGGQNNVGKTAFLEALYLNHSPQVSTLMQLRGMNQEVITAYPIRAWNNLFLNQQKNAIIRIKSVSEENLMHSLTINVGHSPLIDQESWSEILLHDEESKISTLNLIYQNGEQSIPLSALVAHSKGILVKANGGQSDDIPFQPIYWIPASGNPSGQSLARLYDQCYVEGNDDKVMQALKIIEPSLLKARTLTLGMPLIYLARQHENVMPLSIFGDSLNRVADLFLKLLNDRDGILLIDEIENAIHHLHQIKLWEMLFEMAAEFNVQIFATTHSLEMLKAFTQVSLETDAIDNNFYFELARHIKTHEILGIKHDIETLDYGLKHHKGVRGE
jgi:predicted ATP-dependent endonuclease of OLD family